MVVGVYVTVQGLVRIEGIIDSCGELSVARSESISQTSRSDSSSLSMRSSPKRTIAEYCRESSVGVKVTLRRSCRILNEVKKWSDVCELLLEWARDDQVGLHSACLENDG